MNRRFLEKHRWISGIRTKRGCFTIAWWHDPTDGTAHRQEDALRIQRERNAINRIENSKPSTAPEGKDEP